MKAAVRPVSRRVWTRSLRNVCSHPFGDRNIGVLRKAAPWTGIARGHPHLEVVMPFRGHRPGGSARADSRHCPVESPAGRSDGAWATKAAAAITRARIFGWERRKGLHQLFHMGYRTMGPMGFTSGGDGVPTPIVGDLCAPCLPQK